MARIHTSFINENDCIGDTLPDINVSFENLDTSVQSLSGHVASQAAINTAQTTLITNLSAGVVNVTTQVFASGSIIQMVYTESSVVQTIVSPDITQINDLILSITPKRANSKILLQANINSNGRYVASYGFLQIFSAGFAQRIGGVTNTNSNNAIATTFFGDNVTNHMHNTHISYLHAPSYSLDQVLRYAPGACSSWSGTNFPLIINNRAANDMLSVSTITLTEIAT